MLTQQSIIRVATRHFKLSSEKSGHVLFNSTEKIAVKQNSIQDIDGDS